MRKIKIALAGLALAALLTTATALPAQEQDVPKPVYKAPNGKAFPAHWGEPPRLQTRDLRPLPGGYGRGSGTLARWIQGNLARDAVNKPKPGKPKKPIGKKVPTYAEWLKGGKKIPPGMAFTGGTPWFDESKGQRRSPEEVYQMLYGRFRPKPGGPIGRPVQPIEIDPQQVLRLRQEIDKLTAAIKKKEDYLARADLTTEAEQKEQAQLNQMRQRLALMQQLIKAREGKPVPPRGGRKPFPKHWGAPPRIQTRDLRPLPGGYGMGSSTLARWIQKNLDNDAKNKNPKNPTPPPVPQVPPPVGLIPVPAPVSPVPPAPGGAKIIAGDVAKVKAALQAWEKAKQDCDGNYEYTVGFTSAFGFGHTTTIVVANNKVVERRYEEFNRQAPPPPGAKPNGFVEKGDGIGANKKGAPARTLDELYQDAIAIASQPLPKHLRRYIRTNQSGLLLSCFTVDTRIADDAPTRGVRVGQIKLGVKQQKGGQSRGNNKQTQTEQIQKLRQDITAIQQFMARARLTKPAYERYNNQLKQLQARLKQLEDEVSVKVGRQPVSKEFAARHPRGSYVPGRLLVGMEEKGRTQEQCQQMLAGAIPGLKVTKAMFNNSILVVELPATLNEEQAITALKKVAGIKYAELDGVVSIQNNAGHGIQVQPLPRIKP